MIRKRSRKRRGATPIASCSHPALQQLTVFAYSSARQDSHPWATHEPWIHDVALSAAAKTSTAFLNFPSAPQSVVRQ